MAAIMHSVAPQQTVTCSSASAPSRRVNARIFAAIACRSGAAPQVTAYWLNPSRIAWHAASFTSSGGSNSGSPWPRLIAPCRWASRVVSRMTDSVKCWTRLASMTAPDAAWLLLLLYGAGGGVTHRVPSSQRGDPPYRGPRASGAWRSPFGRRRRTILGYIGASSVHGVNLDGTLRVALTP